MELLRVFLFCGGKFLSAAPTNKLIQSIQDEAQDTMERARDILSEANRSKNDAIEHANDILSEANQSKHDTELLKDEIETSQDVLLRERQDLRKQSARLKKQAASGVKTTGIFLQFDKALQRALLEVGVRGEWDC